MKKNRRTFLKQMGFLTGNLFVFNNIKIKANKKTAQRSDAIKGKRPNVIYVFADQWRAQDVGYAGNRDIYTPNIDRLASESLVFNFAVSCMPVSSPYRGSFHTGQYALTHGVFLNDVQLNPEAKTIGKSFLAAGYDTAYIGKWHINGNGRSNYIKPSCRQGFEYFKVLECTHSYNNSKYYDNNDENVRIWEGYDMFAQTEDAENYIMKHAKNKKPFMMVLSWGPPHNPYTSAPQRFKDMYKNKVITLRPNVPEECREQAINDIKGYYSHISAMDECVGNLQKTIANAGIEDNTIFVLTSDHGDMLGSQGMQRKQKPYDESILVPFLLKYPSQFKGRQVDTLLNSPDIMPTLLSMCGIPVPDTVEGNNLYPVISGREKDNIDAALIECIAPFGEWEYRRGGREYRGIRTKRYTYVRDLNGPWLLFDNIKDPYQMNNMAGNDKYSSLVNKLDDKLKKMLETRNDKFQNGNYYVKKWNHPVNENGTVPYTN